MAERPADLPDFANPPVSEVAVGVQFEPLVQMRPLHLGIFWDAIKDAFPSWQEGPRLAPAIEGFDAASAQAPNIHIELMGVAPLGHLVFLSEDSSMMIRAQEDRFIVAWRKTPLRPEYPRYEQVRELFREQYQAFVKFLDEQGLGRPSLRQAEINYVNDIPLGDGWTSHDEVGNVLRAWKPSYGGHIPGKLEALNLVQRFILERDGFPYARLYIETAPSHTSNGINLVLTVRGAPLNTTIEGALEFFDLGRRKIVESFKAITTDSMHKTWGER